MATIREALATVVPPAVLASAEGRVYDRRVANLIGEPVYACQEGRCVMGVILAEAGLWPEAKLPGVVAVVDVLLGDGLRSLRRERVRGAAAALMAYNDAGLLAQPASMTRVLNMTVDEAWDRLRELRHARLENDVPF